jgi:hypothetical protein
MEPLGGYQPLVSRPAGIALGLGAALVATALLELSRQLADRFKGRWYAGNGRDIFHAGAVVVLALPLFLGGLPPALAFAVGGTAAVAPLMMLDWIADRRARRWALLGAVALAILPALLAPRHAVDAGNATARLLFSRQR